MRLSFIICFFIVLLNLQETFKPLLFKLIPIVCLGSILFLNFTFHHVKIKISNPLFKSLILLFILMAIGSFRTNNEEISFLYRLGRPLFLLMFIFAFYVTGLHFLKYSKFNFFKAIQSLILFPYLLASFANILLWITGYKTERLQSNIGKALLLSAINIDIDRVEFPLSPGFNSTSTLLGGLLAISLGVLFFYTKNRYFSILCAATFFVQLLLIDTRSALFYSILIPVFILIFHKKLFFTKVLRNSYLLILIGPIMMLLLLPILSSFEVFEVLTRSAEDLQTGNARFIIWGFSMKEILNFKFQHLIGYGEFGHYGSGVSKMWSFVFSNWENSDLKSPHNTVLSLFFDFGYLGVSIFIFTNYLSLKMATHFSRQGMNECLIFIIFIVYNILMGITESTSGFYFFNYPYLFFGILILLTLFIDHTDKKIRSHRQQIKIDLLREDY